MQVKPEYLDEYREGKPLQSVYIEFVRQSAPMILDRGEFEALRRWLLSKPQCIALEITPEDSHRVTRNFYKKLKREGK